MGTPNGTLWNQGTFGGNSGNTAASALGVPLSTLLYPALRKAGVTLAPGRIPGPDQFAEAIGEINRMVGGWNCNPLMIFNRQINQWPTASQQQSYTLGQDAGATVPADWDGPRPQTIAFANLILTGGLIRRPLKIWDDREWAGIRYQNIFTYPEGIYNNGDSPFSRIYCYPAPDAVYQIELYTWQLIPRFSIMDDRVILPPGYEDALVNNAAVRLASMPWPVQKAMDPQVRVDAQKSLALLQQYNASSPRLRTEGELRETHGTYNYLTGLGG